MKVLKQMDNPGDGGVGEKRVPKEWHTDTLELDGIGE